MGKWLARCADHGDGIALIFARTETAEFHSQVWGRADAVFFFRGRIEFRLPSGARPGHTGGAPSVLVSYGQRAVDRVKAAGMDGKLIILDRGNGHE